MSRYNSLIMKSKLSLLMITKNAEELLAKSLESCRGLVDEVILVDNRSTDSTCDIAKKYGAKIYLNSEQDLGKQRAFGLKKVTNEWVLVLDADEVILEGLRREILHLKISNFQFPISKQVSNSNSQTSNYSGFYIPFQNHFLGRPVNYGGENYKKLWLFRKDAVAIEPAQVHEEFKLKKGRPGVLKHKIFHYSYRSLRQTLGKFSDYAIREARQKSKKGEKTSLKKIILYPMHMFWARFVEDKGYKDGIFRIPLDLGFAYMEFLTYFLMLFIKNKKESSF